MKTLKITFAVIFIIGLGAYLFQVFATRKLDMNKAPVFAERSITINATPEKVYKQLADVDRWNTWLKSVSYAKLNGPLEAETTFDWTVNGMQIHSTLQEVKLYSVLGWTGEVYGIYAIHKWNFKNVKGNTEVNVRESMQGLLASLLKGYFNKTLQTDMQESLVMLKNACESKKPL